MNLIKKKVILKSPSESDSGTYVCTYKEKSISVETLFLEPIKFADSPDASEFSKVLVKGKDTEVTCSATPDGLQYSWNMPNGTMIDQKTFGVNLETDDLRNRFIFII